VWSPSRPHSCLWFWLGGTLSPIDLSQTRVFGGMPFPAGANSPRASLHKGSGRVRVGAFRGTAVQTSFLHRGLSRLLRWTFLRCEAYAVPRLWRRQPKRGGTRFRRVACAVMPPLIWRYCKMFFTESAVRGLIDVIDVIDHAWRRPIGQSAHSA
jgi:hypothetical protein